MFIMILSYIGWLLSAFNWLVNTTFVSAGTIFYVEVVRHHRVIHWLWRFTKCYQYASQFNLSVCLIASHFSYVAYLHSSSSYFTLGRKPEMDSATRLGICQFSLIFLITLFVASSASDVAFSASLSRWSQFANKISLRDSSSLGKSAFLPYFEFYQVM